MTGAHVHLLLTHIPVMAALFGFVILAYAMLVKKPEVVKVGLALFVAAGVAALATYLTGEAAEEAVEHLAGVSEAIIEEHEEAALLGLIATVVLGAASLLTLIFFRKGVPQWAITTMLVLAVVVNGLLAWTANLGGQINHPEIRSGLSVVSGTADVEPQAVETDRD